MKCELTSDGSLGGGSSVDTDSWASDTSGLSHEASHLWCDASDRHFGDEGGVVLMKAQKKLVMWLWVEGKEEAKMDGGEAGAELSDSVVLLVCDGSGGRTLVGWTEGVGTAKDRIVCETIVRAREYVGQASCHWPGLLL